jgi:PAS domain S-box-containing protein
VGSWLSAQDGSLPVLRTAEEVRRLTPAEAERHYPVRLRGAVTFFDQRIPTAAFRFVQDETAGIYFYPQTSEENTNLATGQLVEIEGLTGQGEFAPVVQAQRIKILGEAKFPAARPVSFEQLISGREDSQFVEVEGVVRSAQFDEHSKFFSIELATGGGRLTAVAAQVPVKESAGLTDSTLKVRGVCYTQFNQRRQLFGIRLLVPRPADLHVERPAPQDPFATPTQSIGSLLQFAAEGTYGHRVKVAGTVIYRQNDSVLYIQDETEGLYVETQQPGPLLPGDRVEVLGFPAQGEYTPMLGDAVFRKVSSGPVPVPDMVTADEALKGTRDCRLVRIEAVVVERARRTREEFLVLESGGYIFQAYVERKAHGSDFAYLQNGSKVAVTGVCLIEKGSEWFAGEAWRAKSFRLLLRTAGDIFVLQRPPWWTLARLSAALGVLSGVVLLAFAWVAVLRRRVGKQTRIIAQKLQAEAALKERYVELFENANDIVFTHDLAGRITSINKAGERLLQRPREQIVGRKLLDLVAEEQRADADEWVAQVVKGAELPPAEWDFLNAAGQRVKLEVSTRMVEQGGKQVEVEGIGRDITERKQLEREILAASNREQRRIGHDLHDGVCQQLAAIAYRTDVLADQLQEKGDAASGEAEKIGRLIAETITQTRGVARGLFPVRLEENGLVSALEEMAANASNLYGIKCRFTCDPVPPSLENGTALHLYYIAQEALLNAAKHGKASNVLINLSRANERLSLTVQDDGAGFALPGTGGTGMGIRIMRYRARVIGATLDLKSKPGQGTQVTCLFYPAAKEAAAEGKDDYRKQ